MKESKRDMGIGNNGKNSWFLLRVQIEYNREYTLDKLDKI